MVLMLKNRKGNRCVIFLINGLHFGKKFFCLDSNKRIYKAVFVKLCKGMLVPLKIREM